MPITILDPQTAPIVVDLQNGFRGMPSLHPLADIINYSCQLMEAFRKHTLPVVLVNVKGTAPGRTEEPRQHRELPEDFAELLPELSQQPHDILITERSCGAFANTHLAAQLRTKDVTQVVLSGIATGTGVEATARQAYEAGFNVTLAVDAMTDVRSQAHDYSLKHVFPRLGETGSTQDVLALLTQRSAKQ